MAKGKTRKAKGKRQKAKDERRCGTSTRRVWLTNCHMTAFQCVAVSAGVQIGDCGSSAGVMSALGCRMTDEQTGGRADGRTDMVSVPGTRHCYYALNKLLMWVSC